MTSELETLKAELAKLGIGLQLLGSPAGWECTLLCGMDWKGSVPFGRGETAVAAVQAAMIDRNSILFARKKVG